mmetsp:Transcript_21978/g.24408  ORF Transcript_21978/g.24408 Transcript_21978/m.24408 type:complete len:98 (-) Transcript_21978:6-299(-)
MSLYGNSPDSDKKIKERATFNPHCPRVDLKRRADSNFFMYNDSEQESITLFDAYYESQSQISGTRLSMITPQEIEDVRKPKKSEFRKKLSSKNVLKP